MVNFTVVAGGCAVNPTKRKPANLAVERFCLFLLFAHDSRIPFALEVQYQPLVSLGRRIRVNIHVEVEESVPEFKDNWKIQEARQCPGGSIESQSAGAFAEKHVALNNPLTRGCPVPIER